MAERMPGAGPVPADARAIPAILLGTFAVQAMLAFHWHDMHVFAQFNVLFDSDPNTWLRYYSSTRPDVGTTKHPLAAYYVAIPALVVSKLAAGLTAVDDPGQLRTTLALLATPVSAALKNCLIYMTLRKLRLGVAEALVMTLIAALSLSSVIFGSTPETYGYSGLLIAAGFFLLVSASVAPAGWKARGLWATCFLAVGASTVNIFVTFWLLWGQGVLVRGTSRAAVVRPAVVTVLILLGTLCTFYGFSELRGWRMSPAAVFLPNSEDVALHAPPAEVQLSNLVRFPERLGRSFVPTLPEKKENRLLNDDDIYRFELTFNTLPFDLTALALYAGAVAVLGFSAWSGLRAGGPWRPLVILSLGTIAANAVFFSFYGYNTFLYSQHWQVPAIFVMAAAFQTAPRHRARVRRLYAGIAVVLIVSLVAVLRRTDALLLEACGSLCPV